ncbi:MAG: histidine ammonia-lyase [Candidatus Cloacimonetes bacterium]|nr:histidine ammonia-lyase [Candidatus Cloacimonadota bacterium]
MINIDGNSLTMAEIKSVASNFAKVKLTSEAVKKVVKCREYVEKIIARGDIVYGLTTGFGKFATITIPPEEIDQLQENLIISHATGVGNYLSQEEVRAIMLLRLNVLAKGNSGIRLETLQLIIDMLNCGIHPRIPEKGSVGASGDLAPLSHLAMVVIGRGEAEYQGQILPGAEALQKAGLAPARLKAKEGLALNNGTQVMTGIMALNLLQAEKIVRLADVCAAISIDAQLGSSSAFDELVHQVRPHPGQIASAKNLSRLLAESSLRDSHMNCTYVQDAYSVRCTPQVHGAIRAALEYNRAVLEIEINAATDNPLIFPEQDKVISGGNFHGEPVAIAADSFGIAVAELASISERRMERILNPALSRGLKPFLAAKPGFNSGFMIAQYTAAALVSENKVLAHPSSVDSIPTSANQEDHVSMGTIGAVKARTILQNVAWVLGIELMVSLQALEDRDVATSPVLEKIHQFLRTKVARLETDRYLKPDIDAMQEIFLQDELYNYIQNLITLE